MLLHSSVVMDLVLERMNAVKVVMDPAVRMDHVQMMKEMKAAAKNYSVGIHAVQMGLSVVMVAANLQNVVDLMIRAVTVIHVHVNLIQIVMIVVVVAILT